MTVLSLAARNTLARDPAIRALVGKDSKWTDGWIFSERLFARLEATSECAIVISEIQPYEMMNAHNTMTFPTLQVDIWADPTRNADGSALRDDGKDKILALAKLVRKHLHTVDLSTPLGEIIQWGTEAEVAAGQGVYLLGSAQLSGPEFRPIADTELGWMGRFTYGINQL